MNTYMQPCHNMELDKSALDMNTHYQQLKVVKDDVEVALDKTGQVFVSEEAV